MGTQSLAMLEESPAGSHVIKFLDLLNEGKDIGSAEIEAVFSKRLIEKFGTEGLSDLLHDVRQQDGQLELWAANRTEKFAYELSLRSENTGDWIEGTMNLESTPPYRIDGFGLEIGSQPDAEEPIYSPSRRVKFEAKPVQSIPASKFAAKADEIAQAYHDLGWFSGVVLAAKDGKPTYQRAFGMADIENQVPNTMDTKIRIGSINKDYTAVLVLQQVQRGKLSLEDRLSKFGLGFPKKIADKITVRQLLNHTAGFPDIFVTEYTNNIRDFKNIDDILPLFLNEPLAYEPGTDNRYSNYGYIVLGAILEKTTGKKFSQLLAENIHAVTGCSDTDYDIAENISGEAKSYRFTVSGEKIDHTPQLEYPTPDGGMYATAGDLLQFFQVLFFTEKLLENEHKILMVNDFQDTDRTWQDVLDNPRAETGFAGGGPGVSAVVEMNFHTNEFLIILANTDQMVTEHMAQRMLDAKRGRKFPPASLPPANYLYSVYKNQGAEFLTENFGQVLREGGFRENHSGILNNAGYSLLAEGKLGEAIDLFRANVQLFPKEANPCDSLAEAYLKSGDKANALKYYRKALEIDPDLPSAKQAVAELTK